jgi:beta-glucanase (GH16 family)
MQNFINKSLWLLLIAFLGVVTIQSCSEDPDGSPDQLNLPVLVATDLTLNETDSDDTIYIDLKLNGTNVTNAVVNFAAISGTGTSGIDFEVLTAGKIIFTPEEASKTIGLRIVGDGVKEINESFTIKFYNPINMTVQNSEIKVTILDDDDNTAGLQIPTSGYTTPTIYPGYKLVWADEFEGSELNPANWVYETGTGNGGWGNNELQYYREDNLSFLNGNMVITAKDQKFSGSNYTSSRIKTQGKKAFKFGRIDIRAALPEGKGVWPALWMLGTNITSVNWPACGEIDIMELTGDQPNRVLGTVHYGANFDQRQFRTASKFLQGGKNFQDEFHVFTIIWEEDLIEFYVDDEKYYTVTPATTGNQPYPFNKTFFFIMNVAVGGNLPGNPDATTPFPQSMIVDYIRVFQPE